MQFAGWAACTSVISALKYTDDAIIATGSRDTGAGLRLTVWKLDPDHCEVVLPGWPKTIANWNPALAGMSDVPVRTDAAIWTYMAIDGVPSVSSWLTLKAPFTPDEFEADDENNRSEWVRAVVLQPSTGNALMVGEREFSPVPNEVFRRTFTLVVGDDDAFMVLVLTTDVDLGAARISVHLGRRAGPDRVLRRRAIESPRAARVLTRQHERGANPDRGGTCLARARPRPGPPAPHTQGRRGKPAYASHLPAGTGRAFLLVCRSPRPAHALSRPYLSRPGSL